VSVFSRPAADGDVILGVRPGTVCEPSTVDEAAEVLRESALGGKTLAFIGGGTDLELGTAPTRIDAVVRTGRLAHVVEYSPSDQIVVAEAGLTLGELQRTLASHRQRLALDPPLPERKTLGGIIAANAYGPRRARYGSVRDLIIGISFVRADGTLARGGGKVVKNVAGFDLPKLMIGSLGTLGLITSANFRLHPLPEEEITLLLPGRTSAGLRSLVRGIKEAQLEPTSVVASWREADRFDIAVRFEGFRAGVAEQRKRLTGLVRGEAAGACETLDEPAARAFWSLHDELRTTPALRAKLTALPAHVERIASEILPGLLATLGRPGFLWYATLGLGFLAGSPEDADSAARSLLAARERVAGLGGTLILQAAPSAIRERVDVWGPPPPALPLMQSVKSRLDPEARLAPGRFVGGI
jgi:glycolate oxidase FAD binding subunit